MPDNDKPPMPLVQEKLDKGQDTGNRKFSVFKFMKQKNTDIKPSPVSKCTAGAVVKSVVKFALYTVAGIAGLLLLALIFLDPLLHFAITTIGSSVIDAEISIGELEVSLTRGEVKIIDLKVANQEGFNAPEMLVLGSLYVSVDKNSLFSPEIIVNALELRKLHVTADVDRNGKLNFLALAEKFSGTEDKENEDKETETEKSPVKVNIKKFILEDIRLNWFDDRTDCNIAGFGVSFDELSGSLGNGEAVLKNIRIGNPDTYDIDDMISITSVAADFDYDSIHTPVMVVNSLTVNELKMCAEYNNKGNFNFLDLTDSFIALSPVQAEESTGTTDPQEDDQPQKNDLVMKNILLQDSAMLLREDNFKVQMIVPLYFKKTDYDIDLGDGYSDILLTLHDFAVKLNDLCYGVTDATELTKKMFSDVMGSAVEHGSDLIEKTTKTGKDVVSGVTSIFSF